MTANVLDLVYCTIYVHYRPAKNKVNIIIDCYETKENIYWLLTILNDIVHCRNTDNNKTYQTQNTLFYKSNINSLSKKVKSIVVQTFVYVLLSNLFIFGQSVDVLLIKL